MVSTSGTGRHSTVYTGHQGLGVLVRLVIGLAVSYASLSVCRTCLSCSTKRSTTPAPVNPPGIALASAASTTAVLGASADRRHKRRGTFSVHSLNRSPYYTMLGWDPRQSFLASFGFSMLLSECSQPTCLLLGTTSFSIMGHRVGGVVNCPKCWLIHLF